MSFSKRIGNFFLFIGLMLFFLFIYSDTLKAPHYSYLLFGVLCGLTGLFLRLTAPTPPPQPTRRFRLLKQEKKPNQHDNSKPPES